MTASKKKSGLLKGILWVVVGGFLVAVAMQPRIDIFPLIWRANTAKGHWVDTVEEEVEDDHGHTGTKEIRIYDFSVKDKLYQSSSSLGNLKNVENISYLPENPSINHLSCFRAKISWMFLDIIIKWIIISIPFYVAFKCIKEGFAKN